MSHPSLRNYGLKLKDLLIILFSTSFIKYFLRSYLLCASHRALKALRIQQWAIYAWPRSHGPLVISTSECCWNSQSIDLVVQIADYGQLHGKVKDKVKKIIKNVTLALNLQPHLGLHAGSNYTNSSSYHLLSSYYVSACVLVLNFYFLI